MEDSLQDNDYKEQEFNDGLTLDPKETDILSKVPQIEFSKMVKSIKDNELDAELVKYGIKK